MAPKRILVVEDEAIIAKDIEHTLKKRGYEIIGVVSTGEEALLRVAKERARRVVEENRPLVDALVDALLERDELIGEEILAVIEAAVHPREVDVRPAAVLAKGSATQARARRAR